MCKLESCPVVPSEGDAVDGVLEEVLTDQVKQQLWECVLATSRRLVQWGMERVRAWRQKL